jgi:signal transduction histidine kinase
LESQKKKITIAIELEQTTLPMINGDAAKISRVLRNLLDNAIKYTDEGGAITVKLADRGNEILVSLVDTGIGIPEDQMPHIFDAFYRASRDSKGSGLGLASPCRNNQNESTVYFPMRFNASVRSARSA